MGKKYVEVLASGARTATPTISPIDMRKHRGLILVIDVTVDPASASITPVILAQDSETNDASYSWLTGSAINSVTSVMLIVHPNVTAAANLVAQGVFPDEALVTMTHADADSITYSIGAWLLD